jgi:hypothetical protein
MKNPLVGGYLSCPLAKVQYLLQPFLLLLEGMDLSKQQVVGELPTVGKNSDESHPS